MLSEAAWSVWAKSPDEKGDWLPLAQHLLDARAVVTELMDTWVPARVVSEMARSSGVTPDVMRVIVQFLAGAHDIGKATPAFAVKSPILADLMGAYGLFVPQVIADVGRAHHTVTGQNVMRQWLRSTRQWAPGAANTWAVVIGGHHGSPPGMSELLVTQDSHPHLYGGDPWRTVRHELLHSHAEALDLDTVLDGRPRALSQPAQVLTTAMVIVADWIASNERLFPYGRDGSHGRVQAAMKVLDLPRPWAAAPVTRSAAELFGKRFDLPMGAKPRPVQDVALAEAWATSEPGLLVIEAPMGEGKTEAALAAAEVMAHRFGCGGLFVALPTQATTDAMFGRIIDWLDRIPDADLHIGASVWLGHGKSRLNQMYQGFSGASDVRQVDADAQRQEPRTRMMTHAWLSGRKKASLAAVVVGTIDQLLFAGLKSRHVALRHLGVAGKVVVIDEVHAYDCYMSSYLDRVLSWLGAYRVPVILLSATLTPLRRAQLIAAYRGEPPIDSAQQVSDYPLVTTADASGVNARAVQPSLRRLDVNLAQLPDNVGALGDTLSRALEHGGCALVVCNTVGRALEAATALTDVFGAEQVTLTHARFLASDRAARDVDLLDRFGSPSRLANLGTTRPHRHVVVATQVVEQSLDVDFDVLVTDLAPVDLVLQRMGRMHRHPRLRPKGLSVPWCYLRGVGNITQDQAPEFDRGSVAVYGTDALLRAAVTLSSAVGGQVSLPDDIPVMVERAYSENIAMPTGWADAAADAAAKAAKAMSRRRASAEVFQLAAPLVAPKAVIGWIEGNVGEADDGLKGQAQVRDGHVALECLVVWTDERGRWVIPPWLPGGPRVIPVDRAPDLELQHLMAGCSLRLPRQLSNAGCEDALWEQTPPAWEMAHDIYRLPALVLDVEGRAQVDGFDIHYSPERGLEVSR
jgi:CRISPR-associated endonuclease/helicase Cas3